MITCQEPIEYAVIQDDGSEIPSGHYFCQKEKGHKDSHRITVFPDDPFMEKEKEPTPEDEVERQIRIMKEHDVAQREIKDAFKRGKASFKI